MMNARIFSIAGVAAALVMGASAAQANPFEGDQAIAPHVATASAVSRADVQAQLASAQQQGTMLLQGDRVQPNAYEQGGHLARAAVVKAAHDALVAGQLPQGESAFGE